MKKLLIAIVAAPVVLLVVMMVIGGISTGIIGGNTPSQDARQDIPSN